MPAIEETPVYDETIRIKDLPEQTSFTSDMKFPVDSATGGPGAMDRAHIFQNCLMVDDNGLFYVFVEEE